jgi:isoquinoline 1-oxidoreductase beta subunit
VRLEHAPPTEKLYGNPLLGGVQRTGGSTAIRAVWEPMRQAGAIARTMLVAAAAKRWNVDHASCHAQRGEVLHASTGRNAKYGDLAADAAGLTVPETVTLKQPKDFKLIGTPAKRLDAPSKVNGTAVFGIDVRPPGVKIATLAQSPVFGGRVKSVDDAAAKVVKGLRQIVRLDDAVAVVADHMGAAKKGLAALAIEWDDGPHATLKTDDILRELEKATNSGPVAQSAGDVVNALASAVTKVEATYQLPFLAHAAVEPMNCTVHVRKDGCEVWVGNQVTARAQAAAAKTAGLPLDKVVVHNHLIGGGFGRRLEFDGVIRAVQIAQHVDGPVKVVWTREEDIQHDMYRPLSSIGCLPAAMRRECRLRGITGSQAARSSRDGFPLTFNNGLDPDRTEGTCMSNTCGWSLRAFRPPSGAASGRRTMSSWSKASSMSSRQRPKQDPFSYRRALLDKARPAPKQSSILRRKRPAGDRSCLKGSAVVSQSSSSSGPIWRRLLKSKCRRMARFACSVSSARSTAVLSSTPTLSGRRSRARSTSASRQRSRARPR